MTERLYEAVIVIKDPRTNKDVASQLADAFNEDDEPSDDIRFELLDVAKSWSHRRDLSAWRPDLYATRLSFDKARVEAEQAMLQDLDAFVAKSNA